MTVYNVEQTFTIIDIVERARLCNWFSEVFYDKLFEKLVNNYKKEGYGSKDIYMLAKLFSEKRHTLDNIFD